MVSKIIQVSFNMIYEIYEAFHVCVTNRVTCVKISHSFLCDLMSAFFFLFKCINDVGVLDNVFEKIEGLWDEISGSECSCQQILIHKVKA